MLKINNYSFKKIIFYLLTVFLLLALYVLLDFVFSNTLLKNENCYDYKSYKKGYFYYLKKNCETNNRFKRNFPSVKLYTDKLGLRVGKNPPERNKDKNILIFGDSFTFGVGLDYEDTYVGIIEKHFNDYNVYNFGVGSYAPTVHLYKLKDSIKNKIIPDKILLFLDLTDVNDEASRWVDDKIDGIPKRPEEKPAWAKEKTKRKAFIEKNLKLTEEFISIVRFHLRNLRNRAQNLFRKDDRNIRIKTSIQGQFTYTKEEKLDSRFWKKGGFNKGIKKIEDKIDEISLIAKKNNSEFYLIIYPWAETLYFGEKEFSWSQFGKKLCDKKCILINAISEFEKYKKTNQNWMNELYFLNDEHFNKYGAKLLADFVIKNLNF